MTEKGFEMVKFNYDRLRDRIHACWVGKNIGGTMGAPYEGSTAVNDISGFATEPGIALPNDDLDLQLIWLLAAEDYGMAHLDARVLGEYWLSYVGPHWNEYGIGKQNMRLGLLPPLAGDYLNDWQDSNGAWIRTEVWACMAPGCPDIAVRYACEDACVDHGMGEGTYAAMFVAALESAAFVEHDLRRLIDIGFSKIPANSRVSRAVKVVMDCYDNGIDWLTARNRVVEDSADLGWFMAPANVAFVVLGLLYGEGDFKKSMILAINCGDDTDCTGATIGSIMGILGGTDFVPKDWAEHIGDKIQTVAIIRGCRGDIPKTCTELTERVMAMIPSTFRDNHVVADIHAECDCVDSEHLELGGAVAEALCERSGRSFDIDGVFMKVRVIFDGDPTVAPNGELKIKLRFMNTDIATGPRRIGLTWYLPNTWSVEGRREVYLPAHRPTITGRSDRVEELEYTIRVGENVEYINRIIVSADAYGSAVPCLIPITVLG